MCSGEKLPDTSWSGFIEVKGKVRLEAFEKYVQDLPRSRNRVLMVRCYHCHSLKEISSMLYTSQIKNYRKKILLALYNLTFYCMNFPLI